MYPFHMFTQMRHITFTSTPQAQTHTRHPTHTHTLTESMNTFERECDVNLYNLDLRVCVFIDMSIVEWIFQPNHRVPCTDWVHTYNMYAHQHTHIHATLLVCRRTYKRRRLCPKLYTTAESKEIFFSVKLNQHRVGHERIVRDPSKNRPEKKGN